MKKSLVLILTVFLVSTTIACTKQPKSLNQLFDDLGAKVLNAPLPNVILDTLSGEKVSITDTLKDQIAIVSIWNSQCPHCQADIPRLVKLEKSIKNDIRILYISTDTDKQQAIDFAKDNKIPGDPLIDVKLAQLSATNLNITGTPTNFIINQSGKIIAKLTGVREWSSSKVKRQIQDIIKILEESP